MNIISCDKPLMLYQNRSKDKVESALLRQAYQVQLVGASLFSV